MRSQKVWLVLPEFDQFRQERVVSPSKTHISADHTKKLFRKDTIVQEVLWPPRRPVAWIHPEVAPQRVAVEVLVGKPLRSVATVTSAVLRAAAVEVVMQVIVEHVICFFISSLSPDIRCYLS